MATPFVQGRLRQEELAVTVSSECACCGRLIELEIDSEMRGRVLSEGASPLLTMPMVDFGRLEAPNIIDDF